DAPRHLQPPACSGDRSTALHRLQSRSRDRPVQGRDRRLLPGLERAPAIDAGRMASPDHRGARRLGS
ncbi:MAG: Dioxygenases related to 2-nitropropane dioxygenase, partial [uncultured Sphingomonadaceae bacterium]